MASPSGQDSKYDLSFKILLIGDSGVGKSSLILSFISASQETIAPTIGVDIKIKHLTVGGKRLKLTLWDTAGQERFRTLTNSFYRDAQGIMLVYDVTRRETLTSLTDLWAKEVELYSTNKDCVKMLVGNKLDCESDRVVTKEEAVALAGELGCLFAECSAKTRENVEKCFEQLALKIMEVPSLQKRKTSPCPYPTHLVRDLIRVAAANLLALATSVCSSVQDGKPCLYLQKRTANCSTNRTTE